MKPRCFSIRAHSPYLERSARSAKKLYKFLPISSFFSRFLAPQGSVPHSHSPFRVAPCRLWLTLRPRRPTSGIPFARPEVCSPPKRPNSRLAVCTDRRPRVRWQCLLQHPSVPIDQHAEIVRAIAPSSLSKGSRRAGSCRVGGLRNGPSSWTRLLE
jgi:hypothetical protein